MKGNVYKGIQRIQILMSGCTGLNVTNIQMSKPIAAISPTQRSLFYLDIFLSKCVFKSLNPLTPKISLVILLTVCQTILIILQCGEFGIRSISNPIIDIFLFSSLVWMTLYRYSKEKFYLNHSCELKRTCGFKRKIFQGKNLLFNR